MSRSFSYLDEFKNLVPSVGTAWDVAEMILLIFQKLRAVCGTFRCNFRNENMAMT